MATLIFDFDNTLFETQSHKKRMFDLLASFGIPKGEIFASYEELVLPRERMYDMREHCALLSRRGFPCPEEKVEEFLKSCFKSHLMPGAEEMLAEFKRKGCRLVLLTKGIDSFQRTKVRQSGIEGFFSEIHTCLGKKELALEAIKDHDGAYFINDSGKETELVAQHHPELKCILFASEYGKSQYDISKVMLPVAHSCAELLAMIPKA